MVGKTVGHYKILECLGQGGMGQVWLAEDARLGRRVALKFLTSELARDPAARARLEEEARAVAALNHPNIVTLYSIEEADGAAFLTMEEVRGRTLAELLEAGPLSLERFFELAVPLTDALAAAHERGVVHRDLKPGNVMVDDEHRVKVLDFGVAKVREAPPGANTARDNVTVTQDGALRGTLAYMSPEQVQGRTVDPRSDIFSLGVVLYEMCTGRRPFTGESAAELVSSLLRYTPRPVAEHVSERLGRLIRRCLEKEPERRPQSTEDVRRELEELREEVAASPAPRSRSIAVLPFADMSPQKDQDYFCEGIAEEIMNALTKVPDLRVASRMSSFQFKASAGDSREIGRKLGVDTLLEGSVRKAGSRVRVTAQLIDVGDGYHVWSDRYDRELDDIFAIQDEIAQKIVAALEITLGPDAGPRRAAPTANVEAYDSYLRARQFLNRGGGHHAAVARQLFLRATELDPGFGRAWAGVADCCSFLFLYFGRAAGADLEQAREASRKALELDPHSAEAHSSHGLALSASRRYAEADAEFETALRIDPKLYEALYFHARNRWAQGNLEDARRLFHRAAELRPDDHQPLALLANVYDALGQTERARECARDGLRVIERTLEAYPENTRAIYHGSGALIYLGERQRALEWARRALAIDSTAPDVLYNVACTYARAGEVEDAMSCLERAVEHGFAHRDWIEHDSDLVAIRSHPRYTALLQRMS